MTEFAKRVRAGQRLVLMAVAATTILGTAWFRSAAGLLPEDDKPELIFSHRYHLEEEALVCEDCHYEVGASEFGADNLLPEMDVCGDCHDIDDEDECGTCHSNIDDPQAVPRIDDYSPVFSHKLHVEAELECANCHESTLMADVAGGGMLPGMVQCLDCHDRHAVTSVECTLCHGPDEDLTPISHSPDFIRAHSDLARTGAPLDGDKTCQTCHDTNYCQDCHEGDNLDRFTHPLNYAFTHALDAQANERLCISCHTDRQECVECHNTNLVLPQSHVPGFVNPIDGGLHAMEAENDIESCMACHNSNAEVICQPCHGSP